MSLLLYLLQNFDYVKMHNFKTSFTKLDTCIFKH